MYGQLSSQRQRALPVLSLMHTSPFEQLEPDPPFPQLTAENVKDEYYDLGLIFTLFRYQLSV